MWNPPWSWLHFGGTFASSVVSQTKDSKSSSSLPFEGCQALRHISASRAVRLASNGGYQPRANNSREEPRASKQAMTRRGQHVDVCSTTLRVKKSVRGLRQGPRTMFQNRLETFYCELRLVQMSHSTSSPAASLVSDNARQTTQ